MLNWFKDLYPKVPEEFPAPLEIQVDKTYRVKFLQDEPTKVRGAYGRLTAVINIDYQGKEYSLYVGSHVDLARQIYKLQKSLEKKGKSLKNQTVLITKNSGAGSYRYTIESINEKL